MKVGIIGYPLSGKTSVFNTLTGLKARKDSFVSSGKDANVGLIKVPDKRLDELSRLFEPKKTTPAEINFIDMAGIGGDSAGGKRGFSAQELSWMRTVEAFVYVVRAFEDETITHPLGSVDPLRDIRSLDEEMALGDILVIEKRLERIAKEGKKGSREFELLERCMKCLEEEKPLRDAGLSDEEKKMLAGFQFLSLKLRLVLVNTGEDDMALPAGLAESYDNIIAFCAKVEEEISELPAEEQKEFLEALAIDEPARPKFIRAAYGLLNLICFFTVGKDEVRAWTIERGCTAQPAAGKIHSDIERGFIRAEVVAYDDYIGDPSMTKMKELGRLRLEGKTYVVQDGDIINFRFNV